MTYEVHVADKTTAVVRYFNVDASSERGAFRIAALQLEAGEHVRFVVEKTEGESR